MTLGYCLPWNKKLSGCTPNEVWGSTIKPFKPWKTKGVWKRNTSLMRSQSALPWLLIDTLLPPKCLLTSGWTPNKCCFLLNSPGTWNKNITLIFPIYSNRTCWFCVEISLRAINVANWFSSFTTEGVVALLTCPSPNGWLRDAGDGAQSRAPIGCVRVGGRADS